MLRLAAHIIADFFSICAVNGYPRRLFQHMCSTTVTLADYFSICAVQRLPSPTFQYMCSATVSLLGMAFPTRKDAPGKSVRPDYSKITDTEYGRRSQD